ncbi:MAG: hypothetical protein U0931_13120 [Vulcanimicrobiota bacterium]
MLGLATSALFSQLTLSSDYLATDLPRCNLLVLALIATVTGVQARDPERHAWRATPALVGLFCLCEHGLARLGWAPLVYAFWLSLSNSTLRQPRSLLLLLGQLQVILAPCWLLRTQTGFSTPAVAQATFLGLLLWLGTALMRSEPGRLR